MTKSRTISWVFLVAAVAVAGYFGWQRFYGRLATLARPLACRRVK